MKKKHRDIVVDGIQYGWMVDGCNHVRIWKDKKVIAEYDIEYQHDSVTPGMIAGLIKDPMTTLMWLNAESCPFCGKTVILSQKTDYFLVVHEDDCWLCTGPDPMTSLHKSEMSAWNKRH